jgi:hypothetical protein
MVYLPEISHFFPTCPGCCHIDHCFGFRFVVSGEKIMISIRLWLIGGCRRHETRPEAKDCCPETAIFRNFCVNLRDSLCGEQMFASAQSLDFLELA